MYLDYYQLNFHPFAETRDTEIFFQGAERESILHKLAEDFVQDAPLVRLTGLEGSGKTFLCHHLIRQPLGRQFHFVFLDNPLGSFNDLLRNVCVDLGMEPATVPDQDMLLELQNLLSRRKEGGKKVLLIIDEAEQLFLAALERLMRLICETGEEHLLHVLLVGRPLLAEHLEQLTSYCTGVDINSGYVLLPLTVEETARYLDFRLQAAGRSAQEGEEVFTREAVERIFSAAGGNLRQVNYLADQALQAACSANSMYVLPHHIPGREEEKKESKVVAFKPSIPVIMQEKKTWVFAGGALLVLFLLISLLTGNREKKHEDIIAIPKQPANVLQSSRQTVEVPHPSKPQVIHSEPVSPSPEIVPAQPLKQLEPEPPVVEEVPVQKSVLLTSQEESIVELRPDRIKVAPKEPGQTVVIIEPPAPHPRPSVKSKSVQQSTIRVSPLGEKIFQERKRASAKWLANAYHNRYTVQMMMLASEQAAPNIKRVLAQDEYVAIKNYLYILTKKTSPPTLFVFYGTYDSMEQARQARNNMPLFLRKHHPYALSINAAMKKTQD